MTPPIVIKVGGATVEDPATSPRLWDAVAVIVAAGQPISLVHGGGKAVDRLLERLGFAVTRIGGLRVTPPEQMEHITAVLAGSMNKLIVGELLARGVRAVGLCLGDGGAVTTRRMTEPQGLGLVGEVTDGASPLLPALLAAGYTPVLSSIGIAADGARLNVNADNAAVGVAAATNARALLLLTDVPGVLDAEKKPVVRIDATGVERLIAANVISGGMTVKARAAAAAAAKINAPVVILSGPDALRAWSQGEAVGTSVTP